MQPTDVRALVRCPLPECRQGPCCAWDPQVRPAPWDVVPVMTSARRRLCQSSLGLEPPLVKLRKEVATCGEAPRGGRAGGFWDPWAWHPRRRPAPRPQRAGLSGSCRVLHADNNPHEREAGSSQRGLQMSMQARRRRVCCSLRP